MAHRYGMHGDYLKDGKLDLPELLETPSTDDWAWTRDFIRRRRWQEAVTYRETAPHEYTVRTWAPNERGSAGFDQFVILVRRFGYADFYYHLYWAVDEFKYWTMGWPVSETTVINRARVDAVERWKSQSGPRANGLTRLAAGDRHGHSWTGSHQDVADKDRRPDRRALRPGIAGSRGRGQDRRRNHRGRLDDPATNFFVFRLTPSDTLLTTVQMGYSNFTSRSRMSACVAQERV